MEATSSHMSGNETIVLVSRHFVMEIRKCQNGSEIASADIRPEQFLRCLSIASYTG